MSDAARLIADLRPHIADERVLAAMAAVPRELFVPPELRDQAYENVALGIDCGQTISQPLVVARMAALLRLSPGDRVLDVGTGSGYHAAVLAELCEHVWTIERHPRLSGQAAAALARAGVSNVTLSVGDGSRGLPDEAPFEAINVAAACRRAELDTLTGQLAPGGRLVAPIAGRRQFLGLARREPGGIAWQKLDPVRFVPLIGDD